MSQPFIKIINSRGFSKILLVVFFLFLCPSSYSQFTFQRTYGFSIINEGSDVLKGIDGGFIIAASTAINNSDAYILKINDDGTLQWQFTYGGSNVDHAKALINTPDSCYLIAGYSNSFNSSGDYDIYVFKIDRQGQLLWQQTFGGSDWDFATDVINSGDGGFIIVGQSYSGVNGSSDGIIIKIDSAGNLIWQRILNTLNNDLFNSVCATFNAEFIAVGTTEGGFNNSKDIISAKFNNNGDSIFYKQYGSENDEEALSILNRNGTYICGGSSFDGLSLGNLALRINEIGDSLSTIILDHPNDEITSSVDSSGFNLWITGYTSSFGGGQKDLFISKVDSFGNDIPGLPGITRGGLENEVGNSIIGTPDGGAIAVGYSTSFGPGTQSVYIVKIDSLLNTGSLVVNIDANKISKSLRIFYDIVNKYVSVNIDNIHESDKLKYRLFNSQGQTVSFSSVISDRNSLIYPHTDVPGVYFFQIEGENINSTYKFIIH